MFLAVYSPYWHGGVDLANYFPSERYFNSVVYTHKKFLKPKKIIEKDKVSEKEKKPKKVKIKKADKSQQFSSDIIRAEIPIYQDSGLRVGLNNDINNSVLEQTIQFAKNIVPIVLAPTKDQYPMYYTINATNKSRKKTKAPENLERTQDITYKKEKSRKVETYRSERVAKESFSVKETISFSSRSDTLNEIHLDPSLCCSLTDASEQNHQKKERKEKRGKKFIVSESFEALATEYCDNGSTNIKIHLMNDTDKSLLADNMKMPILNAIKECIKEINKRETDEVITTVQKFVKCNTQQLDNIMEKVTCVERKIDEYFIIEKEPVQSKIKLPTATLPAAALHALPETFRKEVQQSKWSALEQLEDDILEVNVTSEGEEEFLQSVDLSARRKVMCKTAVTQMIDNATGSEKKEEKKSEIGCGEIATGTGMGARPNRLPARYCWTGVARKT